LRFTNHGRRIANHVHIDLKQDFLNCLESTFKAQLEKQKGKECIIGIGQHYDLPIGSNEFRNNPNKALLSCHISYTDEHKSYCEGLDIDFDMYATFFSSKSDTELFLEEMKEQTKELQKISTEVKQVCSAEK
jgi:hypothetical protein